MIYIACEVTLNLNNKCGLKVYILASFLFYMGSDNIVVRSEIKMNNKTFFRVKQRMKYLACQRRGYINE
jgi:hypothetical protein